MPGVAIRSKPSRRELAGDRHDRRAVAGGDADEDGAGCGSRVEAASWLLAKAEGKSRSIPITSPVDRISGPSTMSTPGNLMNGKTDSLTDT